MHARDIGCCIEEILSMLRWRNPDIWRCSGDCQGEIWGNIDRTPAAGGKLCSAPCVCGIRCAAFPGFQRHSTHARHSILPPTTQIYSSLWDALSKTSLLLLQNSNKILPKSIYAVMWKGGVHNIKSSFGSWRKKNKNAKFGDFTKYQMYGILNTKCMCFYQPQL